MKFNFEEMENSSNNWESMSLEEKQKFFQEKPTDVVLNFGVKEIRSYKFILSSVSPIFAKRLEGIDLMPTLSLNDVSAQDFMLFLEYIYSGFKPKKFSTDWKVIYRVSKMYEVNMFKPIVESIFSNLSMDTLSYTDGLILFEIAHLEKVAVTPGDLRKLIIEAFEMQCYQIYSLDYEIFLKLLDFVGDKVPTAVLFRVTENYCKSSGIMTDFKKSYFKRAIIEKIENFDYSVLTVSDYVKFIKNSDIINSDIKFEIHSKILAKGKRDVKGE